MKKKKFRQDDITPEVMLGIAVGFLAFIGAAVILKGIIGNKLMVAVIMIFLGISPIFLNSNILNIIWNVILKMVKKIIKKIKK